MEWREEKQSIPGPVLRKEQEEVKELPLEVLDLPIDHLLKIYKNREIPQRWMVE
ncbi:hypothetical protein ACFLW2_02710 [Chloroflexota bacterium]